MTEEEKHRQSELLTQRLISNPKYQASKQVSLYLSFSNEVATEGILRHIFQSGKRVFIPRYVGDKMDMLRLLSQEDYDSLPLTKWHIKQPPDDDNTREDALLTGTYEHRVQTENAAFQMVLGACKSLTVYLPFLFFNSLSFVSNSNCMLSSI
ncbi:MTHFS [Branchiostoma lanceolatum]|uniref:5-formyltetrahydrofolate cyclo-ligase n=1 Tax=Branchiostoma lanceolatum TaxID=7740 RepID=A0A8J9ZHF7_BRALA|nr:MTHFS [Branchiostoma lanceolatum]